MHAWIFEPQLTQVCAGLEALCIKSLWNFSGLSRGKLCQWFELTSSAPQLALRSCAREVADSCDRQLTKCICSALPFGLEVQTIPPRGADTLRLPVPLGGVVRTSGPTGWTNSFCQQVFQLSAPPWHSDMTLSDFKIPGRLIDNLSF
jgi:hypothetical protein